MRLLVDRCSTTRKCGRSLAVLFYGEKDVPGNLAILRFFGPPVHVEQTIAKSENDDET